MSSGAQSRLPNAKAFGDALKRREARALSAV